MGDDAELYIEMQEPGFWNWVERYNESVNEDTDSTEEQAAGYKRYFLIDYENVNRDGLTGIQMLSESDCIRIYYSGAAETLTFGLHRQIIASKAHFEYIKVQMPIKNAVDCQILFDISDLIEQNPKATYYIVSKDSDFDKAIEDLNMHHLKVRKILAICKAEEPSKSVQTKKPVTRRRPKPNVPSPQQPKGAKSTKGKREAQVRSFFGQHFKEAVYVEKKEKIIHVLLVSSSKTQLNNGLTKLLPGDKVKTMLKVLKPLIKDLPGK